MSAPGKPRRQPVEGMRPLWSADRYTVWLERLGPIKSAARLIYRGIQTLGQRKLLARNAGLRDRHRGDRCLVLGTGVSLGSHDVSAFADEWTFGCNDIYRHPDLRRLKLKCYVFADPYYGLLLGRQHVRDVFNYVTRAGEAFRALDSIFFLNTSLARPLARRGLLRDKEAYYVMGGVRFDAATRSAVDLTHRTPFAAGSLFTMIGAALYMGFKEIYLLGCGFTYSPMQQFHFNARPAFERSADGREAIHAFARDRECEVMRVEEVGERLVPEFVQTRPIDPRHIEVREVARRVGARIFNVTPEGFESPVYERLSSAELYARLAPDPRRT